MTPEEQIEATLVCEDLMCRRYEGLAVNRLLCKQFGIDRRVADGFIRTVRDAWIEEARSSRTDRRIAALKTLSLMTRKALQDGDIATAIRVERLRAEIEGLVGGKVVIEVPTNSSGPEDDAESEGRSEADLDHYAIHGRWPDEMATNRVQ